MPNIDLSILNQRQTPAFYADVLANRPAAGFVGRIFVSTDTYAFYRDNGTSWDLIGGPGTGTVTGTGANGQVTFWNGASTITGSNDLFWDATNGHFGVNTNAPGTALDVHHDQPTVAILNQTVATNDVRIGFQNNGVGLWRIGAFYNAGANDFGIYDAIGAIQPVTVKKTTGQVLIGTSTVGSGKLVVASASSDNGIQIVGASAPSLRIDSAESGPTKRAGLGISTATNNFIQGSADRDFCIFNGSTAAASPILFGIYDAGAVNVQEAARISAARNFLIGTTTDAGQKLQVSGNGLFISGLTSSTTFQLQAHYFYNGSGVNDIFASTTGNTAGSGNFAIVNTVGGANTAILGSSTGFFRIGTTSQTAATANRLSIDLSTGAATFSSSIRANAASTIYGASQDTIQTIFTLGGNNASGQAKEIYFRLTAGGTPSWTLQTASVGTDSNIYIFPNGANGLAVNYNSNVLIGTTTDTGDKLQVSGTALITGSLTTGSPIGIKGTTPFIQWLNNSSTRLGYIQHNASNLVYNADTGQHIFNQAIQISNTVTAAVGIASTHKVSILINGVQYYLLASNV